MSIKFTFRASVVIIFLLSLLVLGFYQFAAPSLPVTDSYYHIKIAYLLRTEGILYEYPWAHFSTWRDNYIDKDFLFHVLLMPFTFGNLILGAKLAIVTFSSLLITTVYIVLRKEKVIFPELFTLLMLTVGIGHFFSRLHYLRGHLLSVLLAVISLYLIFRRKPLGVGVVALIYALSYGTPYLVIIFATIYWLACFLRKVSLPNRSIFAAVFGMVIGLVIHPYFPENINFLYLQTIKVLFSRWFADSGLQLASELTPYYFEHPKEVIYGFSFIIFFLIYPFIFRKKLNEKELTLFFFAAAFFLLTLFFNRFIEYAAPFGIWYMGVVVSDLYRKEQFIFSYPKFKSYIWSLSLLIAVTLFIYGYQKQLRNFKNIAAGSRVENAAIWLKNNTPKGEIIFTCNYSKTHELFFFNHQNYYMVAGDELFFYEWNKELWKVKQEFAFGRSNNLHGDLVEQLGLRYGYCRNRFIKLRNQLEASPQFEILFKDKKGYIFRAKES